MDWLLLRPRGSLVRAVRGTALWWPIVIIWMVVARASQQTYGIIGAAPVLRPLVALDAIAFYLGKIVWPVGLAVDYGRMPQVAQDQGWLWWTWIIPVGLAGLLVWKPKRELIAAGLLLVIAIAPVLGLTPFLFQYYSTVADHYLYVAMIGPALALAWVVWRWDAKWVRVTVGMALVVLALLSIRQAGVWRNDETLFAHTIHVNPNSFSSHHNLGSYLVRQGDLLRGAPGAREHYLRARDMFARAIELRRKVNRGVDDNFDAHQNLALTLERLDEWNAALLERQRAMAIALKLPVGARGDLGAQSHLIARNLMMQGRWAEALPYLDAALKANPGLRRAAEDREQVLRELGK
jgi:tetratricopeptide (TPR) repeat protein